ncbi:helix-hairpin-helix domain-containing protein [Kitasatospora sp. NPDC001547]|uniref:helix-hairpin-helix domain-containing protein n=1 Tax=Kitasatospora sp. NPDC001547 TaxID=3364015 RepID=UPI0036C1CC6C
MTTLGLGAAKRHAINETVRLRMAALLPAAGDEPEGGSGGGSAGGSAGGAGGGSPGAAPPAAGERAVAATGPPSLQPSLSLSPSPSPSPSAVGVPVPSDADVAADPAEAGARPRFSPFSPFPSYASALALDRRAVAGLAILLLFAVGYAVQHFWLARPQTVAVPALAAVAAPSGAEPSVPADAAAVDSRAGPGTAAEAAGGAVAGVVVDIGGRVHVPGLHTLPAGSRVADALRAAGGPLPDTDTRNLNLARVLVDGEQILVGEQTPVPAQGVGSGSGSGSGPPGPAAPRPPVSLNRATLEQLDTLPGVGPTLAQRILAYRASHGSFRTLDQLRQVSGIGARTYAELRPLLTL